MHVLVRFRESTVKGAAFMEQFCYEGSIYNVAANKSLITILSISHFMDQNNAL